VLLSSPLRHTVPAEVIVIDASSLSYNNFGDHVHRPTDLVSRWPSGERVGQAKRQIAVVLQNDSAAKLLTRVIGGYKAGLGVLSCNSCYYCYCVFNV